MKPYNNPDPNQDTVHKQCSRCKEQKLLHQFGFKKKETLTYRPECRECRNVMLRKEYAVRKEKQYQALLKAQDAEPTNSVPDHEPLCPSCHQKINQPSHL